MEDKLKILGGDFSLPMFITKVNNIFVMYYTAIMMDDEKRVAHFLSDEVYQNMKERIAKLNAANEREMFDELNVKTTVISDIIDTDDEYIIKVTLVSRYMDYVIDKTTFKYKRGVNDRRIEKTNYLELQKKKNVKDKGIVSKCPSCGASIDVNRSGHCEYCGMTFDNKNYDWILTSISDV